ncbi:cation diffusion facilitator family transporter [Thalassotalea sp. PS06]|uniref:cation diffusion facilitator family transporter n=1 Tax=Thalassotalea sp. PS06 TaxID=2594005 RepID=UPI0011658095|nr:cation diffusion facilitator family transporter [Thalassotalea sp. PS06]QDP00001.1 cation diffusion facilitator family transporter [Thalassotalea sp. PS06]
MTNLARDRRSYQTLVTLAARLAVALVVLMLVTKILVWWHSPSASLLGSTLDSGFDLLASITNLLIVRWSLQPPDKEHRFGHGKAENMAAVIQSVIISISAILLITFGWQRMLNPIEIAHTSWGIGVSIVAIVCTLALVRFQHYVIEQTGSVAISADQLHYKSDLFLNIAVIMALAFYQLDWRFMDGLMAIVIGVYLIYGALTLIYTSVQQLLDHQLPESELTRIDNVILNCDGVLGYHQLKTRRAGQHRFIQFHLEIDQQLSLLQAHEISDKVQAALEAEFTDCQVIIHQDPVVSQSRDNH